MKKHLLRAVLIAALAVTAAFGTAAFDAEPVESVSERVSTANETALSEEAASLAMDANGEIELTFGLQAVPQVNVGTTEASYEISDDGEYGYVTVTGKGYAGIVTVTAGEETKTVHLYGGSKSKPGLNIYTGTVDALKFGADTTYKNDGKNFTGTTANGVKYTGAVNYSKANGIRILYDTDADTGDIRFTGVTIGLDGAYTKNGITYANRYAERFTARPYVKIGDVTYYGACYTTSLVEKAQALIDSGDTNEEYRTIVEQAGKEA